eukprot:Ihof_evm6s303 gene=Ihof_evmTU6s303
MDYVSVNKGAEDSTEFRIFFQDKAGQAVSPWHDIPLYANEEKTILNAVIEIPRWTNAKMEIDTKNVLNPIKQDVKKGALRYVKNPFPYKGYIWNYGAFPQTWEDPSHVDHRTKCKGDNDPLDLCEIGFKVAKRGEIKQVKVLGVLAMIDEGETDWKILVIDVTDPLAAELNDIEDVQRLCPNLMEASMQWFKVYKFADGKPLNDFAFEGKFQNKAFATALIEDTHKAWKKLMIEGSTVLDTHTVCHDCPTKLARDDANAIIAAAPTTSAGQGKPVD